MTKCKAIVEKLGISYTSGLKFFLHYIVHLNCARVANLLPAEFPSLPKRICLLPVIAHFTTETNSKINQSLACLSDKTRGHWRKSNQKLNAGVPLLHQPYFFSKSLVLFLMRVKTMTTHARIHGGKLPPKMFNLWSHSGCSLETNASKRAVTATPIKILVMGLTKESYNWSTSSIVMR